jgi:ABC-type branched-subunit amino acid transport system ATPase component
VRFKGREITGQPPHRVFRLGVGYVPEGWQIFPHLDVGENLLALSRALMSNPRVLLMDQLSEGLAPQIAAEVMTTIRLRCRTCRSRSRGYGSEGAARTRFCARRVA